jgi:ribosome recycling factor
MYLQQLTAMCEKTIAHLEQSFSTYQLGRSSTWLLDGVSVYVHSRWMEQKLQQIANITIVDAQTMRIEPWDKTTLRDIEKAIYEAQIGFTPINHGDYILVKVPPLTQERRKEITKLVSKEWEDAKIALRNHRHDTLKLLKKDFDEKTISETEKSLLEKQIDETIKQHNSRIDTLVKHKNEEVMSI